MTSTGKVCQARNRRGEPCGAYAVEGYRFCFGHCPELAEQRKAGRVSGGLARQGRSGVLRGGQGVVVPLASLSDVVQLLEQTVGDVLALENSIARARAVGYLAGIAARVLEASELEQRIARLEEKLGV